MTERVAIPKGTVVVCPLCLTKISKITRDVRYREVIGENDIEGFKKGDKLHCPNCGFPFAFDIYIGFGNKVYLGSEIYTDKGWMPDIFGDLEETQDFVYKVLREALIDYIEREGIWKDEWLEMCKNPKIKELIKNFK